MSSFEQLLASSPQRQVPPEVQVAIWLVERFGEPSSLVFSTGPDAPTDIYSRRLSNQEVAVYRAALRVLLDYATGETAYDATGPCHARPRPTVAVGCADHQIPTVKLDTKPSADKLTAGKPDAAGSNALSPDVESLLKAMSNYGKTGD